MHTTDHYPGAGSITVQITRHTKAGPRTSTVTRHGYLLCSLWATGARRVAAAKLKPIGSGEVMELLPVVRQACLPGTDRPAHPLATPDHAFLC